MIRFQFAQDHRDTHAVKRICDVVGINRSSYYKWRETRDAKAARARDEQDLLALITGHYERWDRTLGYRRVTAELAADPQVSAPVNHKRVARLMRMNNLVGVHLRKPKSTTIKDP